MMAKIDRFMIWLANIWLACGLINALVIWALEPITVWTFLSAIIFGPLLLILAVIFKIGGMFV